MFQPREGVERIARADLGQRAAVEQLQELDHEFDVADAAVAGFDLAVVGPGALRLLLDAAFERLDARNVGRGQIAAVNPGRERFQKFALQLQPARCGG